MLHPLTQNRHLSLHNSLLLLSQVYPGCQRLFMRGFRFLLSLFNWSARKAFFLAASPSCIRLSPENVSAADEGPRRTREQTFDPGYPKGGWLLRSLSQGNLTSTCLYVLTVIRVTKTKNGVVYLKRNLLSFSFKDCSEDGKMGVDGANKTRGYSL